MRIAIVADAFPPMRTSAAVQLRDLSAELLRQGHQPVVLIPCADLTQPFKLEEMNGVSVLRLKGPRTKDIGYIQRTIGEVWMPFAMLRQLKRSPMSGWSWDGVIWYSPSIFFGPIVQSLRRGSKCRSYLILRDVFPEWAVDMGLLNRGLIYRFFKLVESYQYRVANVIGVQASSNCVYFKKHFPKLKARVEVLQNWLAEAPDKGCSISMQNGPLAGRTVFVYAGNMGVAQGMDILLDLAERLADRKDIGFLFVGRGSDSKRLARNAMARGLENVLFFDEIEPAEVSGLYAQCHVGIVALDPRHRTPNIPGKFLTYMQSGLPVLANINAGNDLAEMIKEAQVGRVCTTNSVHALETLAKALVDEISQIGGREAARARCRAMAISIFSPQATVTQIVAGLSV
jgi:glycosyltransferase involved in cell wall biosynthesis